MKQSSILLNTVPDDFVFLLLIILNYNKMFFNLIFTGKKTYNLKISFSESKNDTEIHKPGTLFFNDAIKSQYIQLFVSLDYIMKMSYL